MPSDHARHSPQSAEPRPVGSVRPASRPDAPGTPATSLDLVHALRAMRRDVPPSVLGARLLAKAVEMMGTEPKSGAQARREYERSFDAAPSTEPSGEHTTTHDDDDDEHEGDELAKGVGAPVVTPDELALIARARRDGWQAVAAEQMKKSLADGMALTELAKSLVELPEQSRAPVQYLQSQGHAEPEAREMAGAMSPPMRRSYDQWLAEQLRARAEALRGGPRR